MSKFFYFISASWIGTYLIIRFCEMRFGHLGLISNYLTDFIALPVVFSLLLLVFISLNKQKAKNGIPILFVIVYTILWSFYFESYLPSVSEKYTADRLDVVMYTCGAGLFYMLQPRMLKNN